MTGYHVLANAIVIQAVKDYQAAVHTLRKDPENRKAMKEAIELEEFFRSGWYRTLTGLDAEYLLDRLRKEDVK